MAPVIMNLNNKVLVKDHNKVWIWGQVHDVNTTELLVDFDIPGKKPMWIPLLNVFMPAADRHVRHLSDKGIPYLRLFAAVREDEREPYIWKRYVCEDHSSQYVFAEIPLEKNVANRIVPYIRSFKCKCSSEIGDDEIFSCNPVTPTTFYRTKFSADQAGTRFLRSVLKSKYISLSKSGSEVAALVIRKTEVVVIGFRKDQMERRWPPSSRLPLYYWELFCMLGYWDWQRYKHWENEITEWDMNKARRMVQLPILAIQEAPNHSAADDEFAECLQNLPGDVMFEIFGHLDTFHQSRLRRVCTDWNALLTACSITNHIYILGPQSSAGSLDCGLLPLSTSGNWWYAGRSSFEYRLAKVLSTIDSDTRSLRLSKLASAAVKPFLQVFENLKAGNVRLRILIFEDCEIGPLDFDGNYVRLVETPNVYRNVFRAMKKIVLKTTL